MASRAEIDFTYTITDKLFRLSIGELGDFSGAKYDGDSSLSLEWAQERKHAFVVEQLRVPVGGRVLELGCGWGGMLAYLRDKGIRGVGVTLSRRSMSVPRDYRTRTCSDYSERRSRAPGFPKVPRRWSDARNRISVS